MGGSGLLLCNLIQHLARSTIFQYQLFMARSISNIRKKRGRGRPKVGAIPVLVRLLPDQAARLDSWRHALTDSPSRPEAIRRLLEQSLPGRTRVQGRKGAHKASELAAKTIDGLADKSQPASQHARAKRRLIHGPKEFRNIRADQPKRNA
jgi:hypothetical protein